MQRSQYTFLSRHTFVMQNADGNGTLKDVMEQRQTQITVIDVIRTSSSIRTKMVNCYSSNKLR